MSARSLLITLHILANKVDQLIKETTGTNDKLKWIEKQVVEIRKIVTGYSSLNRSADTLKYNFPISSDEDLSAFLQDINDFNNKTYREIMVNRCRQEGGGTSSKMVRNIWGFLFDTRIQKKLSWSGQNDKLKLKGSPLFDVVLGKNMFYFFFEPFSLSII